MAWHKTACMSHFSAFCAHYGLAAFCVVSRWNHGFCRRTVTNQYSNIERNNNVLMLSWVTSFLPSKPQHSLDSESKYLKFTQTACARVGMGVLWDRWTQSFRLLIMALYSSIPAVLNAMLITSILSAVYAIVATNVFSSCDPEYFGDFDESMFTMFQVTMMFFNSSAMHIIEHHQSKSA